MTPLTGAWEGQPSVLDAKRPIELTIGAASPLWFLFAGAAATGAAYWWMLQWTKPLNLEAMMGQAPKSTPAPALRDEAEPLALQGMAEPAFAVPPLAAGAEQVAETIAEPVTATPVEAQAAVEGVAEAAVETAEAATDEFASAVEASRRPVTQKAKSKARPPIQPSPEN